MLDNSPKVSDLKRIEILFRLFLVQFHLLDRAVRRLLKAGQKFSRSMVCILYQYGSWQPHRSLCGVAFPWAHELKEVFLPVLLTLPISTRIWAQSRHRPLALALKFRIGRLLG